MKIYSKKLALIMVLGFVVGQALHKPLDSANQRALLARQCGLCHKWQAWCDEYVEQFGLDETLFVDIPLPRAFFYPPASLALVSYLVEQGADVYAVDSKGFSMLQRAVQVGSVDVVRFLLEKMSQGPQRITHVNYEMGPDRWRALHYAAAADASCTDEKFVEIVRLLIGAGAYVNAQGKDGWTALHVASLHGNAPIIEVLLAAKANATLRTLDGKTAKDLALGYHDSMPYLHPAAVCALDNQESLLAVEP